MAVNSGGGLGKNAV